MIVDRKSRTDVGETLEIPPFITLQKGEVPFVKGTIGGNRWQGELEGRQRSSELLNQPIADLVIATTDNDGKLKLTKAFKGDLESGLTNVEIVQLGTLLQTSPEALKQKLGESRANKVTKFLDAFLSNLCIAPEVLVVARIQYSVSRPLNPSDEEDLRKGLYTRLRTLTPACQDAIIVRHGLRTGVPKDYTATGNFLSVVQTTVSTNEENAFDVLRTNIVQRGFQCFIGYYQQ